MLKLLLSLEKESMSARLLAQVRTFNLHALPELQLQGAVLVLQLQLSRPGGGGRGRKGKQNQNKHPVSRVNIISCPRAAHYYEAMKQQAPLWGRLLAGLLRADSGSGLWALMLSTFGLQWVTLPLHRSHVVLPAGLCRLWLRFSLFSNSLTGKHLRHHEVRLLGNQRVLLVDEMDPLLNRVRVTSVWKLRRRSRNMKPSVWGTTAS